MDHYRTVLVAIATLIALISLPLLRPTRWAGCAYCGHRLRDEYPATDEHPATPAVTAAEADQLVKAETDRATHDPHWSSVSLMLNGSSTVAGNTATLDYYEQRSLAAQYLAAYADSDVERMQVIADSTTPDQLMFGMTYVAYTHAIVVAFQKDGDLRAVLDRDCQSAIRSLAGLQ